MLWFVDLDRRQSLRELQGRSSTRKKADSPAQEEEKEVDLDIDAMFEIACGMRERGGWGMFPSEFWELSPSEWWSLYDFNIGKEIKVERDTMDRLKKLYYEANPKK